jgi:AcrR family transcriptional regulator
MIGNELTRHTQATRDAIIEAALDLFIESRGSGFSMQEVADRVSITHRTLYRYFPSRRDLIVEAAMQIGGRLKGPSSPEVSTVSEWIDAAGVHFEFIERNREIFSSVFALVMSDPDLAASDLNRDAYYWHVFRNEFPGLGEEEATGWFAMLRHLISGVSYLIYRHRFAMDPAKAATAVRRAAEAMVVSIRRANDAAEGMRSA